MSSPASAATPPASPAAPISPSRRCATPSTPRSARIGEALRAARPDALIVIAAEHFANFFMNNMPAYAIGMADHYEGPIEDPDWLGIERTRVPGQRRAVAAADRAR